MKTKLPTVLTAKSRDLSVRTLRRGILTVRSQCRGLHAHQRFSSVALLELFVFLLFALCYLLLGRKVMTNLKVKKVKSLSRARFFATPWTVAHQAPPSMGYSRQEYWSGLPFPSPGESSRARDWTQVSRIAGRCFNLWATREAPWPT